MSAAAKVIGYWKIVSWQREIVATGQIIEALGSDPVGYITFTPDGRVYAFAVKKDRPKPAGPIPTEKEKAALFDTMLAYGGTYTVHDDRIVNHVDISWNQAWTGTDLVRFYKLDGNEITIAAAPAKDPHTGQEVIHRLKFRKA